MNIKYEAQFRRLFNLSTIVNCTQGSSKKNNSSLLAVGPEVQLLREERHRHHAVREHVRRDPPEPAHQPHLLVRPHRPLRPPPAVGGQL